MGGSGSIRNSVNFASLKEDNGRLGKGNEGSFCAQGKDVGTKAKVSAKALKW
jgi:hypothetical protein